MLVHQACPELPENLVRSVLAHARPAELAIIDAEQRVPLRLKNIARGLHLQAQAAHAIQGFYEPELFGANTEHLVLTLLRKHNSLEDARIEIRQHTPIGKVRASAGPEAANHQRLLIKTNGQYVLYDKRTQVMLPAADFFEAMLQALPATQRTALGFAPGEGAAFKGWVMDALSEPEQRRTVLASARPLAVPPKDTLVLVQKPMHPVAPWNSELFPCPLQERVEALYPYATQRNIEIYMQTLEDPQQLERFEAREVEKAQLQQNLRRWVNSAPADESPILRARRQYLAGKLQEAWEQNLDPGENGVPTYPSSNTFPGCSASACEATG